MRRLGAGALCLLWACSGVPNRVWVSLDGGGADVQFVNQVGAYTW